MKRIPKSVITGSVALLLLLAGFQVALLFARTILRPQESLHGQIYKDFAPIPININRADSVALLEIPGIGPYYASRILHYRRRLGAFAVKEQLMEIRGIDYEKFKRMASEIEILPEDVWTHDIWTLPADSLSHYPYLDSHSARDLVVYRQTHPKELWKVDSLVAEGVINERSARGLKLYFD